MGLVQKIRLSFFCVKDHHYNFVLLSFTEIAWVHSLWSEHSWTDEFRSNSFAYFKQFHSAKVSRLHHFIRLGQHGGADCCVSMCEQHSNVELQANQGLNKSLSPKLGHGSLLSSNGFMMSTM